ncbi:MAG: Cytosolic protein [Bryobacterales bacterium]|jgi:hypothetical protein|nr:Cytosolic protein [Bryobacterales bacterium]
MAVAAGAPPIQVTDAAWEAIEGAYDLQVHVYPDVIERRIDDLDLAQEFLKYKLKGFVLKSHYVPTYERAKVVTKANPGITAIGAITLNHSVGGLNPVAIEIAGRSGNKIVWMPTVDAANDTAGRHEALGGISPPPITVLGDDSKLNEPARRCLETIAKHNMVLATGHLGRKEIYQLVRTGKEMGLKAVMVTHAEFPSQDLSIQEQVELANLGATIEHCFTTMYTNEALWDVFFESVRQVGPERVVLSTDLGQTINPPVAEGFAMFAQKLLDAGFSKSAVRRMTVTNPAAIVS